MNTLITCFMFFFFLVSTNSYYVPRLNPFPQWKTATNNDSNNEFQTFDIKQVLDHFSYTPLSYTKFKQRYYINFKHWGGAHFRAPIFVIFGGEYAVEDPTDVGFVTDNATYFKALVVYIEHRYYGRSVPFESGEAFKNASMYGYLNSMQALADYDAVIKHVKNKLHAQKSPVVVIGSSYSGMLAAWFRLKYPHMTIGALSSSAPVLYFDNITPQSSYFDIVTRDFKEASETCFEQIVKSWSEIDKVASHPNGLFVLSQRFNTCSPLKKVDELKGFLESMYFAAAQYDMPPTYLVNTICDAIDRADFGSDVLSRIYGGVVVGSIIFGNVVEDQCYINSKSDDDDVASSSFPCWEWQLCSEIVMPVGRGNGTMFQPRPFNFKHYAEDCEKKFGVSPRPHWITSYFGGHDMKLVLHKFGSNIIFSNGLRDPYSGSGVLHNLSDSIVALVTVNGSHGLDIQASQETDPAWLVEQRKKEVEIIHGWITQYYAEVDFVTAYPLT